MKRMRVLLAAIAIVVVAPSPTAASTPTTETQDDPELAALLLTVDDMPIGWAAGPDNFFDSDETTSSSAPAATVPDDSCADDPIGIERALPHASASFTGDGIFDILGQGIVGADSADDAIEYVDLAADYFVEQCPTTTDEDGVTTTCAEMSFPDVGDASFAMRCTPDGLPVSLGVVFATVDDKVILLLGVGEGGEGEFLADVVSVAVERVRG